MLTPTIEFEDRRLTAWLQRLKEGGGGRRTMGEAARYIKTSTQRRFPAQRGPDGKSWLASKRARAQGGQTLRDSNRLFRSITTRHGETFAAAGTNVVYAAPHQFGVRKMVNVRPHRRMSKRQHAERGAVSVRSSPVRGFSRMMFLPARPMFGFNQADRGQLLQILANGIRRAAKS